jgi:hypothetical protein
MNHIVIVQILIWAAYLEVFSVSLLLDKFRFYTTFGCTAGLLFSFSMLEIHTVHCYDIYCPFVPLSLGGFYPGVGVIKG